MGEIGDPFQEDWIFPLGTSTFAGRTFPVPAQPERLLEAMYGPGWRVPDPAYHFDDAADHDPAAQRLVPRPAHAPGRLGPDGTAASASSCRAPARARWRGSSSSRRACPPGSSTSAAGRGADALWFARQGVPALALDHSRRADNAVRRVAEEEGLDYESGWVNLHEPRSVVAQGARVAHLGGPPTVIAHHVVDATDRRGLASFVRFSRLALPGGGRVYVDFVSSPAADRTRPAGHVISSSRCPSRVLWTPCAAPGPLSCTATCEKVTDDGVRSTGGESGGAMADVNPEGPARRGFKDRAVEKVARAVAGDRLDNLQRRLDELEAEVQECRQLNLRLAELTDLVEQLLLPIAPGPGEDRSGGREVLPGDVSEADRRWQRGSIVHIGLPKTATTYLQTILWGNREALARAGRAAPGRRAPRAPVGQPDHPRGPRRRRGPPSAATEPGSGCAPTSPHWPGDRDHQPRVLRGRIDRAGRPDGRRPGARRGAPRRHRPRAARACSPPAGRRASRTATPAPIADYALTEATTPAGDLELAHPRHPPCARAVVAGVPARAGARAHAARPRGAARREIWDRFAGLIGIDPDSVRPEPAASPTRRWGWSRPRRCAGSTPTSTRSARRSTAAPTSAPTSPTSDWCPATASRSGPPRSGSRRSASAGGPRSTTSPARGST